MNLRNLDRFLFSDEEMNPRQNAVRDEVLTAFTPMASNLVMKIIEAGDNYLEFAENQRNTIIEIGSYKVWVKKLDERGLPWVNDTKSSVKRINQKAEGEDVMPVLILGYQLNQIEHISQVTLSYMEGDQHLWAPIDLGDMAATNQIAAMTVPATEEPVVGVKPGKQRDKEKAAL